MKISPFARIIWSIATFAPDRRILPAALSGRPFTGHQRGRGILQVTDWRCDLQLGSNGQIPRGFFPAITKRCRAGRGSACHPRRGPCVRTLTPRRPLAARSLAGGVQGRPASTPAKPGSYRRSPRRGTPRTRLKPRVLPRPTQRTVSNPNCGKPEMGRDVGRPESSSDADAVVHDLMMAKYILRPVPAGTNGSVQQFAPVLRGPIMHSARRRVVARV